MNLRVSWVNPGVAANQRPLLLTTIEMRTDPSFPFTEQARVQHVANPNDTVLLPDLAAGVYEVRVRAYDGIDFGPYSAVASIELVGVPPAIVPPGQPTGLVLTQE